MKKIDVKKILPEKMVNLINDILSNPEKYSAVSICCHYVKDDEDFMGFCMAHNSDSLSEIMELIKSSAIAASYDFWVKDNMGV